jgi:hypothetical protein
VVEPDPIDPSASFAAAIADREAQQVQEQLNEPEPPISFAPDSPVNHVSPAAYNLIVQHETGGRGYYEKVYKGRPAWPGAQSGITIGFGYDLGYYSSDGFESDWSVLDQATIGEHHFTCYATRTWNSLPNCDQLPNDCFGALDITFNRGNSYSIPPPRVY